MSENLFKSDNNNKFNYMMLSRLKMDCDYYLRVEELSEAVLWAGSIEGQIDYMKEIWNSFTDRQKPEWLTYDEILEFEQKMTEAKNRRKTK